MNAAVAEETNSEQASASAKTEVTKVRMNDGREVSFAGKKRMLKTSLIPGVDGYDGPLAVRFDFKNGEVIHFVIPDGLKDKFAAHGAEQKLGDQGAGYKDNELDDMILDIQDLADRLSSGNPDAWAKERVGGGGFAGTSVLARALAEFRGAPLEAIKAFLKGKTPEQKKAMRADKRLQPIVRRLEEEDAAKAAHVDTDSLFDELGGVQQAN